MKGDQTNRQYAGQGLIMTQYYCTRTSLLFCQNIFSMKVMISFTFLTLWFVYKEHWHLSNRLNPLRWINEVYSEHLVPLTDICGPHESRIPSQTYWLFRSFYRCLLTNSQTMPLYYPQSHSVQLCLILPCVVSHQRPKYTTSAGIHLSILPVTSLAFFIKYNILLVNPFSLVQLIDTVWKQALWLTKSMPISDHPDVSSMFWFVLGIQIFSNLTFHVINLML